MLLAGLLTRAILEGYLTAHSRRLRSHPLLYVSFPLTPMGPAHEVYAIIYGHLPSWEHTLSICEVYLEIAVWPLWGVSRQ